MTDKDKDDKGKTRFLDDAAEDTTDTDDDKDKDEDEFNPIELMKVYCKRTPDMAKLDKGG